MRSTPTRIDDDYFYERIMRCTGVCVAGGGEELYSLANLRRELIPDLKPWYSTLPAMDINLRSLERANQLPSNEDLTVEMLQGRLDHRLSQRPAFVEVRRAHQ